MSVNPLKCSSIFFDFTKEKLSQNWQFFINNCAVQIVQKTKLLGLWITNDLKWSHSIQLMISKASRRFFLIRKLKSFGFSYNETILAYKTFIRPIVEFASVCWGPSIPKTLINNLAKFELRVLSIICNKHISVSKYTQTLSDLHLESLQARRHNQLIKFGLNLLKSKRFEHFLPEYEPPPQRLLRNSRSKLFLLSAVRSNKTNR